MLGMKRILSLALAVVLCLGVLAAGASAASNGWVKENGVWHYYKNGAMLKTYFLYLYENGGEVDFQNYRGEQPYDCYYFDASGAMKTGWVKQNWVDDAGNRGTNWYYFGSDGRGADGWLKIDGVWYYFYDGTMAAETMVWDDSTGTAYWLGADGTIGGGGWHSAKYYTENGTETRWYYTNSNGTGYSGWLKDGGAWYYIVNGRMACNEIIWDENAQTTYWMNANGTIGGGGWHAATYYTMEGTPETEWYYTNSNGTGYTGWLKDGGEWYYISSGRMVQNGVAWDGNVGYYMDAKGHLAGGGWHARTVYYDANVASTEWFYTKSNGQIYEGWLKIDGVWYYFLGGRMAYNEPVESNGVWYWMDASGKLGSGGWHQEENRYHIAGVDLNWYYMKDDGSGYNGWLQEGSVWYYIDHGLMMCDRTATIGGKNYTFDANGAWVK